MVVPPRPAAPATGVAASSRSLAVTIPRSRSHVRGPRGTRAPRRRNAEGLSRRSCRATQGVALSACVACMGADGSGNTGLVKLLKRWVVEDCGRVINPQLADEQVRGGCVQGLAGALYEHCIYDRAGQL